MTQTEQEEFDIEALLEAPFKKDKVVDSSTFEAVAEDISNDVSAFVELSGNDNLDSGGSEVNAKVRENSHTSDGLNGRSSHRRRSRTRSRSRNDRSPRLRSHSRSSSITRDSRRSRSRHSPRHSRSDRSPRRSRYDDYSRRSRNSRSPDRRRRYRSPSFSPQRSPSPEPVPIHDPQERDRRTVFCQQLAARLTNRDLFEFLSPCGKIREAKIVQDKISRRSKGVAYVEFYSEESIPKAIQMTGHKLLGIPIIVGASEAFKNAEAEARSIAAGNMPAPRIERLPPPPKREIISRRLVVANLGQNITENDLTDLFEACGRLDSVKLHVDSTTGKSKGYAFIKFRTTYDARFAIKKLHTYSFKGRSIDVKPIEEDDEPRRKNLDEADGVSLNALSRANLMAKLARDEVRTSSKHEKEISDAGKNAVSSTCLLLKNMFDPKEASGGEKWREELEDDVYYECKKYGRIAHIRADPNTEGFIYLKFETVEAAEKAHKLNGIWFGGRRIEAVFLPQSDYFVKFPKVASLR